MQVQDYNLYFESFKPLIADYLSKEYEILNEQITKMNEILH